MNSASETCPWALKKDDGYLRYHDEEWGRPSHDDTHLFEHLVMEGAQAGLSWHTILKRREGYRDAFAGYDIDALLAFTPAQQDALMLHPGIIRNRAKIKSVFTNARAFKKVQEEFGSFDNYIWSFTGGKPIDHKWKSHEGVPPENELSQRVSKDMKKRGFSFVGSVGIYAYLQSIGVINDHIMSCPAGAEIRKAAQGA